MKNGEIVTAFEREFASYVGARYAIALCNGTATLHTALVALGVKPGDRVAVPPLTMSATTIAVLHVGAVPVFCDVSPRTWLLSSLTNVDPVIVPVSLYGLHQPYTAGSAGTGRQCDVVDDAAQTLRRHSGSAFTSYSFQASKILALGEGGMLVTDSEELATKAREFSSLGYRMAANQPRIDPAAIKSPVFDRHHSLGWNYRMNDLTAKRGFSLIHNADKLLRDRRECASLYRQAIEGCDWLTPQHVPDGWTHDYWAYAVATDTPERLLDLLTTVERHGGERPYPAWKLTYQEPAFRGLGGRRWPDGAERPLPEGVGLCPVAESFQPRLAQFQTNDLASAARNAKALRQAIHAL